jgi:hypothetical protein
MRPHANNRGCNHFSSTPVRTSDKSVESIFLLIKEQAGRNDSHPAEKPAVDMKRAA